MQFFFKAFLLLQQDIVSTSKLTYSTNLSSKLPLTCVESLPGPACHPMGAYKVQNTDLVIVVLYSTCPGLRKCTSQPSLFRRAQLASTTTPSLFRHNLPCLSYQLSLSLERHLRIIPTLCSPNSIHISEFSQIAISRSSKKGRQLCSSLPLFANWSTLNVQAKYRGSIVSSRLENRTSH